MTLADPCVLITDDTLQHRDLRLADELLDAFHVSITVRAPGFLPVAGTCGQVDKYALLTFNGCIEDLKEFILVSNGH